MNCGDVKFLLRRNRTLPNNVIGYVSLNKLTLENSEYLSSLRSTEDKLLRINLTSKPEKCSCSSVKSDLR